MADAVSNFPKMGEEPLVGNVVNVSGNRSPYTMPVARKGPSSDSEPGDMAVRGVGAMASGEHNGPTFAPLKTVFYPNSPEFKNTGRGMRRVPSKGDTSFWSDEAVSQSGSRY